MPFEKGSPGQGRKPKGSKHQRTIILEAMKAKATSEQEFAEMLLDRAKEGCSTSITVITNRMWKVSKLEFNPFKLPESSSREETADNIIAAMVAGNVSPDWALAAMAALRGSEELTNAALILERLNTLEGK